MIISKDPSICRRHPGVPAGSEPCERCGQFLCLICLLEGDITGSCGPCYEPLPKLPKPIIFRDELKNAALSIASLNFVIVLFGFRLVQLNMRTSAGNAILVISLSCVSVSVALVTPYLIA
jgi:hypothetical protein